MTKDECADWIAAEAEEKKKATVERKRLEAEEKKKATAERKRLERLEAEETKATVERKRLEAEEKKATAERKRLERLEAEETKATAERKRLAEMTPRDAATAKRAKVKHVDAASDKRDAALYLKTNTQYAIDFMADNKERIITAVADIKKWSADEKNRRYNTDQLPGVRSDGKKWRVSLCFSGITWYFGYFEMIQKANYALSYCPWNCW